MSVSDPFEQLRKLAALKDEKIVGEGEFERLKTELLSRIVSTSPAAQPEPSGFATAPLSPPESPSDSDTHRVTPQQVAELSSRLSDAEKQYQLLSSEFETFSSQLRQLKRRLKYYSFLIRCRKPLEGVALGPIGPVLILPALGVLAGTILAGTFISSTSTMFLFGIFTGFAAFLFAINAFVFPADERIHEKIAYLQTQIVRTEVNLDQMRPSLAQSKTLRDKAKDEYQLLLAQYQSDRNVLLSMDWRNHRGIQFELFLRDVFVQLGFQVNTTKTSGDQGVDLLAFKNGFKLAVQAKGYAESVGNAAVQQAYAGMSFYGCNHCAVITNSTFTSSAHQLAQKVGCTTIDGSQIEALILGKINFI